MRAFAGAVLVVLAAGCGVEPAVPQYMLDLPRNEEETLRVCEEIRHELASSPPTTRGQSSSSTSRR